MINNNCVVFHDQINHIEYRDVPPSVMIDGQFEPELSLVEYTVQHVCSEQVAYLGIRREVGAYQRSERARIEDYIGKSVQVFQSVAIDSVDARLVPMITGTVRPLSIDINARRDRLLLEIESNWTQLISQVYDHEWFKQNEPKAGWTIESWVNGLNIQHHLSLDISLLDYVAKSQPVFKHMTSGRDVVSTLNHVFAFYGLVIQHGDVWDGKRIISRQVIREIKRGRKIRLGIDSNVASGNPVTRVKGTVNHFTPIKVQAIASPEVVESTFELKPGWDFSLGSEPDSEYGKETSSDFNMYYNVYRRWVLNDDGRYSIAPFNQNMTDLSEYFTEPYREGHSLVFGACLTLDDSGQRRDVIVEMSLDNGESWFYYPGAVVIHNQSAEIYFDDTLLSLSYLAAAKMGTVKVRVTGSIASPNSMTRLRAYGNPFLGPFKSVQVTTDDRFKYWHIHQGSRFYDDVMNGLVDAEIYDQRTGLLSWMGRYANDFSKQVEYFDTEVAGAVLGLNIGDLLNDVQGWRLSNGAADSAVQNKLLVLESYEIDYDLRMTKLKWVSSL